MIFKSRLLFGIFLAGCSFIQIAHASDEIIRDPVLINKFKADKSTKFHSVVALQYKNPSEYLQIGHKKSDGITCVFDSLTTLKAGSENYASEQIAINSETCTGLYIEGEPTSGSLDHLKNSFHSDLNSDLSGSALKVIKSHSSSNTNSTAAASSQGGTGDIYYQHNYSLQVTWIASNFFTDIANELLEKGNIDYDTQTITPLSTSTINLVYNTALQVDNDGYGCFNDYGSIGYPSRYTLLHSVTGTSSVESPNNIARSGTSAKVNSRNYCGGVDLQRGHLEDSLDTPVTLWLYAKDINNNDLYREPSPDYYTVPYCNDNFPISDRPETCLDDSVDQFTADMNSIISGKPGLPPFYDCTGGLTINNEWLAITAHGGNILDLYKIASVDGQVGKTIGMAFSCVIKPVYVLTRKELTCTVGPLGDADGYDNTCS